MRMPTNFPPASTIDAMQRLRAEEAVQSRAAASGRRLNRPSDDPEGMARATALRADLESLAAAAAALTHGRTALAAADRSLGAMEALVGQVETLGVQGATGLVSAGGRQAIAASIRAAAESLFAEANRTVSGYTIFSGARTTTPAFSRAADSSFVYEGDTLRRRLTVDGDTVRLNVPGGDVLAGPVNAGTALETLALAVEAGDTAAVAQALTAVEGLRQQVVRGRTEIGLEMGRLDAATDRLTRTSERLTVDLARIEDADLLEVATALERIRLHLSAGLGATGQAETHTLFDVLA